MALDIPAGITRIGFVSTRIAGTDGVSLETKKWAEVLRRIGLECFFIAGECDEDSDHTRLIDEAHFEHPSIRDIQNRSFEVRRRDERLTADILSAASRIKQRLHQAIEELQLDVLIVENAMTIPMNIPLGWALVHVVQERDMACIAHHHDFYWERERFLDNRVDDFIRAAFPPALKQIEHVAINSQAAEEFSRRTGISCRVVPNVMDFASPPDPLDDYARRFRKTIGLAEEDVLILQPTRVVARKGIEHAIELVRLLDDPRCKLVITHATGDEGDSYAKYLRRFAKLLGVKLVFAHRWISDRRGTTEDGQPIFTIQDVYPQADLVTYTSTYEGFGNAFLEAIYFKRPIVCNRYAVFRTDIEPCGFRTVLVDGFLTEETVRQTRQVLFDQVHRQSMVEHNYNVARHFFSYDVVDHELRSIFRRPHIACRCGSSDCCTSHEPGCEGDCCHKTNQTSTGGEANT